MQSSASLHSFASTLNPVVQVMQVFRCSKIWENSPRVGKELYHEDPIAVLLRISKSRVRRRLTLVTDCTVYSTITPSTPANATVAVTRCVLLRTLFGKSLKKLSESCLGAQIQSDIICWTQIFTLSINLFLHSGVFRRVLKRYAVFLRPRFKIVSSIQVFYT
ncbi:hypothetical protein BC835DRAFT_521454 [Cytidiella melzeri]|nr:hypothetical protein BC835DRAFT_521454 [Cytidiella melzeri]